MVIEQVSAVEHANVAGVVSVDGSGEAILTSGRGRPLIVTTLDIPAAMRLLAAGRRRRLIGGAVLAIVSLGAIAAGLAAAVLGV